MAGTLRRRCATHHAARPAPCAQAWPGRGEAPSHSVPEVRQAIPVQARVPHGGASYGHAEVGVPRDRRAARLKGVRPPYRKLIYVIRLLYWSYLCSTHAWVILLLIVSALTVRTSTQEHRYRTASVLFKGKHHKSKRGQRNALGSILGKRNNEWLTGTARGLAVACGFNTHTGPNDRFPIMPETHEPSCKRQCVDGGGDILTIARAVQTTQTMTTGYFAGYIAKVQPCGRYELKKCTDKMYSLRERKKKGARQVTKPEPLPGACSQTWNKKAYSEVLSSASTSV